MASEARRSALPDVEITAATAQFGAQFIETRVEAANASHALLDILAAEADGYEAAIVSAFGDLGLATAKRMLDISVIGLSEAPLHTAYTLRRRIVSFARHHVTATGAARARRPRVSVTVSLICGSYLSPCGIFRPW